MRERHNDDETLSTRMNRETLKKQLKSLSACDECQEKSYYQKKKIEI
jgi:hypothetical protein